MNRESRLLRHSFEVNGNVAMGFFVIGLTLFGVGIKVSYDSPMGCYNYIIRCNEFRRRTRSEYLKPYFGYSQEYGVICVGALGFKLKFEYKL